MPDPCTAGESMKLPRRALSIEKDAFDMGHIEGFQSGYMAGQLVALECSLEWSRAEIEERVDLLRRTETPKERADRANLPKWTHGHG
jgi:hypothetical protein